jgi:CIC family chloride channel protein
MPAWIAAGMGAFLAACSHAPLMAVVMIFEMTGNPQIIVPLLLVCVLSVSVKKFLRQTSLYSRLLPSEKEPVLAREDVVPLLLRPGAPVIAMSASCVEAEALFVRSRWQHLYVLDAGQHFAGALSLHDFGPYLRSLTIPETLLPQQMLRRDYPRILPRATLGEMLAAFSLHSGERLPVIDAQGHLLGHICKTDLLLWLQEAAAPEI